MAQHVKIIDVTKSFVVVDPNYFPENQGYTQSEDTPEKMPPILSYEGYNFLPTIYGYKSFFGINSTLNIAALTSRVDKILLFQKSDFNNYLIALCEDGIWWTDPTVVSSTWTHVVTHAVPTPPVHYNWTYCVIENNLYCYKEGTTLVHKVSSAFVFTNFTPSFLNMAGQKGIFRANGRLGFWDSANSVSWSDLAVLSDFTPSVTTRAGNATFNGVRGTIITILAQGDGFVIYTTKGIVGVRFSNDINMIWEANTITDTAGIAYPKMVTSGITDSEHYAFTNTGIKKVGVFNALSKSHAFEEILTDTYDLLKESQSPVYLDFYAGRYLFLSVIDNTYIDGMVSFTYHTIDSVAVRVLENNGAWTGVNTTPISVVGIVGSVYTARSVAAAIASNLSGRVIENMMWWWNASIGTMGPTPPSGYAPATPYITNASTYQHVPNTPIYSGVTFNSGNAVPYTDASQLSSLNGTDPTGSVSYANGGAMMGATLTASLAMAGVMDAFANEMYATQVAEWVNFETIQTANKVAILAIPNKVNATVQGGTAYTSSALAQTAIDALVASGGGTGNSHQVGADTAVGSFLSGAGTIAAPVIFPNPATSGFNQTSITMTFLGGWDVKKRTVRTYSIRAVAGVAVRNAVVTALDFTTAISPQFPPAIGTQYGATDAEATALALAAAPSSHTQTLVATPTMTEGYTNKHIFISGNIYIAYDGQVYNNGVPSGGVLADCGLYTITNSADVITQYYIDYVDTTSIVVTVNPTITATSTFTANQLNLRWAYIAQGEPLGSFTSTLGSLTIPGAGINGSSVLPPYAGFTYPGASFLMADGSAAPVYPTFAGAFVFDSALKKWGKMKNSYKQLLEMAPINATGPTVTYSNFGISLSMMDAAGAIKLFDTTPADSWIRYGKIGYSRLGFTKAQEIRVHFRSSSTGNIILDSSIDGRALEPTYSIPFPFTTAASIEVGCYNVGRWHTVTVSGNWDLQYMEFRANSAGIR